MSYKIDYNPFNFFCLLLYTNTNNTDIADIDNRLKCWSEYKALIPIRSKYISLKGNAKEQFYNTHKEDVDRVQELQLFFKPFADENKNIGAKKWEKERSTLIDDNKLCEWKMKALKEEIGIAEKIKKTIDEISRDEIQSKDKKRVMENEL